MRWLSRSILTLLMITIMGCSLLPFSSTIPGKASEKQSHSLFDQAERDFAAERYGEALTGYNSFLRQTYDDRLADAAMFKIGKIYRLTRHDEDSRSVFSRLVQEFPRSPLVPDAMLEILTILFERGDFDAVVAQGVTFTHTAKAASLRPSVFKIIADAYSALGNNLEAARFYYRAWNAASDKEEPAFWTKLKETIEKLDSEEIQQLITLVADRPVMGFLLYQLGMTFIMEEKYDDALSVLNAFVEQFPDRAEHQDALDMIQSLSQRSHFASYTVGCMLPLSGSYAVFGRRALDGIELAVSQMNQISGGASLKLIIKDTRSDADTAAKVVGELDQENVGAILGPMTTSESAAAAAQARGIPIMVFTQREGVADLGDFVFRNFITPQMQVQALVAFAVEKLGAHRFAILYPNENYGKRYMDIFSDQVARFGGVINGVEAYDPEINDFSQPIKKLASIYFGSSKNNPVSQGNSGPIGLSGSRMGFDALFLPDAPKKAAMIVPQLAYYDIRNVHLLGTNLWHAQALIEMSGDYMKNALIADGFFAESQSQNVIKFVTDFRLAFDRVPGIIEAMAYDSAMMVFQAMRLTPTNSRNELKAALLRIRDFDGVTGRTSFAANGEAEKDLQLLRIEDGRFVQFNPSPITDATPAATVMNQ